MALFADAADKALANSGAQEWQRYGHGLAVVESKRWGRPLDRAGRRDEATAPSTQMLRYLRRIDDLTSGKLRWSILANGGLAAASASVTKATESFQYRFGEAVNESAQP